MSEHDKPSGAEEPKKTSPVVAVEEQEQDGVDLRDILGIIAAGKWLILAVTVGFTALAVIYSFLWPATWEADALIQVNQFPTGPAASSAAQSTLVASILPTGTMAAAEVEIMTSRAVLLPVVRRMHLNIIINKPIPVIGKLFKPKHPPPLVVDDITVPDAWKDTDMRLRVDSLDTYTLFSPGGKPIIHGETGKQETALNGKVKITVAKLGDRIGRVFRVQRLYDSEAVYYLQKNLTATQLGGTGAGISSQTGVVELELEGRNPYAIRRIVNALADQYMQENIAAMATQAQKSLSFVNSQLPQVNKKANLAQSKLSAYEAEHGVVNIDAQTQAVLQQITTYEGQLTQLELARVALAQEYKPDFPGYASIAEQENSIKQRIAQLNDSLKSIPAQQLEYVQLTRDAQVYGQLYQQLLATQQDLEVTQAGTVGTARIVDHAIQPYEPVWPIIPLVIIIGVGLGLIFGVVAVLVKSALSRGVLDATELERTFGLPVYAIVPHSREQDKGLKKSKKTKDHTIPVLAQHAPQDAAVEALRSLRTSLSFALWDAPRRVITFSGTSPGVGKSFLTANVAHVLGMADQRVLVIDGDMRKGHLHRYFRVKQKPGLSDALSGQAEAEAIVRKNPLGNGVDFVPTGPYPPGAFDLVSSPRFERLIDAYAEQYDVVIIDVPPVLSVAEGLIISRFATANFLVIKAGGQTDREIHLALERMRQNGVRVLGFVFNNMTPRAASATFGRYAAGYGYGYGYYRAEGQGET